MTTTDKKKVKAQSKAKPTKDAPKQPKKATNKAVEPVVVTTTEPTLSLSEKYTTVHKKKIRHIHEENGFIVVIDEQGSQYKLPPKDAQAFLG